VQTGFPHKLEIIKTQETDDARKLERELHKALADFRLHGEWFSDDVLGLLDLT
jgi:Meiotically up-regulated gene 113